MMEAIRLAAALALPWLAGYAIVRAILARSSAGDVLVELGYGHFVGVLLLTLLLRGSDVVGLGLAFLPVSGALAAVALAAFAYPRLGSRPPTQRQSTSDDSPTALRWLAVLVGLLLLARLGALALEVWLRPLFAWDSWSQWGTKAKVWSGLGQMAPFVDIDAWLLREPGRYTDTAPHYPATLPLMQAWMSLALGRWDDALINLPWLGVFAALACGLVGVMRRLGTGASWAVITTYLALSVPFVNVHVALAGYADLHVAAAYALAAVALAGWEITRDRAYIALMALPALLLPLLKIPGIAWLGTLALGAVIATLGTTRTRVLVGAGIVTVLTIVAAIVVGTGRVPMQAGAEQQRIAQSLVQHLFAFGSWNLGWYLAPIGIALAWREALALRGTSATLAAGLAFLAWTFFVTRAGDWVVDYTTVNRALLHIMPALIVFAALVFQRHARARGAASRPAGATAA